MQLHFGAIYRLNESARSQIRQQLSHDNTSDQSSYPLHRAVADYMLRKTGDDTFNGIEWSPHCTEDAVAVENASGVRPSSGHPEYEEGIPDYILTDDGTQDDINAFSEFRKEHPLFRRVTPFGPRADYIRVVQDRVKILKEYVERNSQRAIPID
jgi:hypothetical protein